MDNKYTPFTWLEFLTVNKKPWESHADEDKKTWSTVLMNKIIGTNPQYVEFVNYIQKYISILPPKQVYLYYQNILPNKKVYFPFKKPKKIDTKLIEQYAKYTGSSIAEATELCSILGKKELVRELERYGLTDKEISK